MSKTVGSIAAEGSTLTSIKRHARAIPRMASIPTEGGWGGGSWESEWMMKKKRSWTSPGERRMAEITGLSAPDWLRRTIRRSALPQPYFRERYLRGTSSLAAAATASEVFVKSLSWELCR